MACRYGPFPCSMLTDLIRPVFIFHFRAWMEISSGYRLQSFDSVILLKVNNILIIIIIIVMLLLLLDQSTQRFFYVNKFFIKH
jgi:hypothetical protein